jgi:hypothetical protein
MTFFLHLLRLLTVPFFFVFFLFHTYNAICCLEVSNLKRDLWRCLSKKTVAGIRDGLSKEWQLLSLVEPKDSGNSRFPVPFSSAPSMMFYFSSVVLIYFS